MSAAFLPYRLKLPERMGGIAESLLALGKKDRTLPPGTFKFRFDEAEGKLHLWLRFPKEGRPPSEWKWVHFSVVPSARVEDILRGGGSLRDPRFYVRRGSDGRPRYFLEFKLPKPSVPKIEGEVVPPLRVEPPVRKRFEGWSLASKLAVGLLILVFASLLIYNVEGIPFMVVGSSSMEPTLERGDVVYLEGVSPSDIKPGDVVAFKVSEEFQRRYNYPAQLIHRVEKVEDQYLITKGDATGPDPFKTSVGEVIGRYSGFKIPKLGHVFLFLQTAYGRTYAIIVISSLLLYATIPPWMERRKELEERVIMALRSTADTQGALVSFSSAMREYAMHLKSHTAAIRGLAKTAQHLDMVTTELEKTVRELKKKE